MKLFPTTKVNGLLDTYPFLLDFLIGYNPKFKLLKKKTLRATMGRMATLSMAASMGGISIDTLLRDIAGEIKAKTEEEVEIGDAKATNLDQDKLERLKKIIKDTYSHT